MSTTNTTKNTFAPTFCASGKGQDMLMQSTLSIDTATTASSSTTSPSSTENVNIDDAKCLANALISVPTQNKSSTLSQEFQTFTCAQHQTQTVAMEMGEINEESEVISNTKDAMTLQEDNDEVENAEPDLFEQSLTKLLKPRKKERHYFFMAEDILRDLDEEDGVW